MKVTEQIIREHALARIADLFNIPIEELRLDAVLGKDLHATFRSYFRHNEMDRVDFDIRDVADRKINKELNNGETTIYTVGDYCDHMVRCYETKPEDVSRILKLPTST